MTPLLLFLLLAVRPNSAALYMESQLSFMRGDMERAEELAKESIRGDPDASEPKIAYAEILLQKGDLGKARDLLQEVLKKDPNQQEALSLLSTLSAAQHDWTRSEEYVRRAYTLHKSEANAFILAQILVQQERYREALDIVKGWSSPRSLRMLAGLYRTLKENSKAAPVLKELLEKDPFDRESAQGLSEVLEEEGMFLEAAGVLEKAFPEEDSEARTTRLASLYRKGGNCARAMDLLNTVKEPGPDTLYEKAQCLVRIGKWEDAEALLDREIADTPKDLFSRFLLLRLKVLDGRLEDAQKLVEILESEKAPEAIQPFLKLEKALLAQMKGDYSGAEELLESLRDDPDTRADAMQNLYELQLIRGCPDQALRAAEAIREMNRDSDSVFRLVAQTWLDMGDLKSADLYVRYLEETYGQSGYVESGWLLVEHAFPREALAIAAEMEARFGENRESRFLRAGAFERLGEIGRAETEFKAILERHPKDATVLNYLGYMLLERAGRTEEGLEYIREAVKIAPDSGAYLDSLGWGQYLLKNYGKAYETLQRASRMEPLDPTILEHLGDSAMKVGKKEEAARRYRQALNLQKKDADALMKKIAALLR